MPPKKRGHLGWGIRAASINEALEKRCAFFWRLEEIWGTRPNVDMRLQHLRSHSLHYQSPHSSSPRNHCLRSLMMNWMIVILSPPTATPPHPVHQNQVPQDLPYYLPQDPLPAPASASRSMPSGSGSGSRAKRDCRTMLKQASEERTSVKSETALKKK